MSAQADDLYRKRYGDGVPAEALDELTEVIVTQLSHRSVRAHVPEPVSDATLGTLIAAAQSASTSGNMQLWSVIAVRDRERLARLSKVASGQRHVAEAPLLLVWLADLARARLITEAVSSQAEGADYLESTLVAVIDAAIAAQNASLAAESLGLGTVFIGALRNDPLAVAEELALPQHVFPLFGLVVGRPDPSVTSEVKPRLPQRAVLHHEQYELDNQAEEVQQYEKLLADFYTKAGLSPSWMRRIAHRFGSVEGLRGRDKLREAFHRQGFELR